MDTEPLARSLASSIYRLKERAEEEDRVLYQEVQVERNRAEARDLIDKWKSRRAPAEAPALATAVEALDATSRSAEEAEAGPGSEGWGEIVKEVEAEVASTWEESEGTPAAQSLGSRESEAVRQELWRSTIQSSAFDDDEWRSHVAGVPSVRASGPMGVWVPGRSWTRFGKGARTETKAELLSRRVSAEEAVMEALERASKVGYFRCLIEP